MIDENALIITPFHVAANRIIEHTRGPVRHGSCGQGVGQTIADAALEGGKYAVRAKDLGDMLDFEKKLRELQRFKQRQLGELQFSAKSLAEIESEVHVLFGAKSVESFLGRFEDFEVLADIVPSTKLAEIVNEGVTVFEGAQGVLLDQVHGFHPHVTRTDITFTNANRLLDEARFGGSRIRIGVLRPYMTRHGAGPLVTEDHHLSSDLRDAHNMAHPWQGNFRVGWFDKVAMNYALDVLGRPDCLAVTNVDRLDDITFQWKICDGYAYNVPRALQPREFFRPHDLFADGDMVVGTTQRMILGRGGIHRQEELTRLLGYVRPEFRTVFHDDPDEYLKEIENSLGIPIGIISRGPTARDKEFLAPYENTVGLAEMFA